MLTILANQIERLRAGQPLVSSKTREKVSLLHLILKDTEVNLLDGI
jgi:hypothetical protein